MTYWQLIGQLLLSRFKVKTVDFVLRKFDAIVDELEQIKSESYKQLAVNNGKIAKLKEHNDTVTVELNRAHKAAENIKKLLG